MDSINLTQIMNWNGNHGKSGYMFQEIRQNLTTTHPIQTVQKKKNAKIKHQNYTNYNLSNTNGAKYVIIKSAPALLIESNDSKIESSVR